MPTASAPNSPGGYDANVHGDADGRDVMSMSMPMPAENRTARISADFFFRGVSFTHEGWSGNGGGYASDEAAAQLLEIHDLSANAIALVPYA